LKKKHEPKTCKRNKKSKVKNIQKQEKTKTKIKANNVHTKHKNAIVIS